ncbi:hypothetical protein A2U01_0053446, partial [Trifolium medium]|nr:hypothetical protein [Trifolium medium]
ESQEQCYKEEEETPSKTNLAWTEELVDEDPQLQNEGTNSKFGIKEINLKKPVKEVKRKEEEAVDEAQGEDDKRTYPTQ